MFLTALVLSCRKDEPVAVKDTSWCRALAVEYGKGSSYLGYNGCSDGVVLYFSGGTSVKVPDWFTLDDCRDHSPKSVSSQISGEEWMLDGKESGYSVQPGISTELSTVFYAYYTRESFVAFFSNGEIARFLSASAQGPEPTVKVLPKLHLTTEGGASIKSKEKYIQGTFSYADSTGIYPGNRFVSGKMQIKGRGNTSWSRFDKKPYHIKAEEKISLFGKNKDRDWVLIANHSDKTLVRNLVAMEMSRRLQMNWTPTMYNIEVWLNGSYLGVYTLSENKEVSKGRVDIDVEDGAVYLEMDKTMDEPTCFKTLMSLPVMFKDPEQPSGELLKLVKNQLAGYESALLNHEWSKYRDYIDVKSFMDYYIVQEISKNIDGKLCKSTFLTWKPGEKLVMYHLWDFDIAFGNCNYFTTYYPKLDGGPYGFEVKDYTSNGENTGWYHYMFMDPDFVSELKLYWAQILPLMKTIPEYIDEQVALMGDAVDRNFEKWPILGVKLWPNLVYPDTYAEEIEYLKSFYTSRLTWLDSAIMAL